MKVSTTQEHLVDETRRPKSYFGKQILWIKQMINRSKRRLILNDNHTDQHQFAIQPLDTKISVTTTEAMIQTQTQTRSWKDQTSHDLEQTPFQKKKLDVHLSRTPNSTIRDR